MTTDANVFARPRTLPTSASLIFGIVAFAFSIAILAIVVTTPDASCSNLATGTMFTITGDPTGRVYVCKDRGLLPNTHVDIFWNNPADGWAWQRAVGSRGTIEIVELPR